MLTGAHGKGLISARSGTGRYASLEAEPGACMGQMRQVRGAVGGHLLHQVAPVNPHRAHTAVELPRDQLVRLASDRVTEMEMLYPNWRDEGKLWGIWRTNSVWPCPSNGSMNRPTMRAPELKASYPLSLADPWIAASALEANAIPVHRNPKFEAVSVAQEPPHKSRAR